MKMILMKLWTSVQSMTQTFQGVSYFSKGSADRNKS